MPRKMLFPGGSNLSQSYNGLQQYETRILKDPAGNSVLSQEFGYDAVGNITATEEDGKNVAYSYDKLYRLVSARYPEGDVRSNEFFLYDGVGNRKRKSLRAEDLVVGQAQYNSHNQLVSSNGVGYLYNLDGHLIESGALQADGNIRQSETVDQWAYQYNARERMTEARKNGQVAAVYRYDAVGRRISKTLPVLEKTTYFLYSEEGIVGEYSSQGNLLQEYAYNPTKPWMTQPLFTRAKSADAPTEGLQIHYFGSNQAGAPEIAFLKTGRVTWRAKMQAFGETLMLEKAIQNNLRFPGQYFDLETSLNYNYFRDYNSAIGRYIQSDPIGLRGGPNTYGYVLGNPTNLADPFGLAPGDLFATAHDAELDAAQYARSFANQRIEYGGWVYPVDACWTYNFTAGTESQVPYKEKLKNMRPDNARIIWHTHPVTGRVEDQENLSGGYLREPGDIEAAETLGVGIYLNTPSGNNIYYDPEDKNPETKFQSFGNRKPCECEK